MAVIRACYSNRTDVQVGVEFKPGIDVYAALDRAMQTAAENIDANLHRQFYPFDGTLYFDWPNQGGSGGGQYAYPWRLWLDQYDCCVLTAMVTGGVSVPLNQVFLEPVNHPLRGKNWYEYLELDRSSTAALGGDATTPQHAIALTGTWGNGADADQVGTFTANVGSSDATVSVSDSSNADVGDLLYVGYGRGAAPFPSAAGYAGSIKPFLGERILVTGRSLITTGLSLTGSGVTTASNADQTLTVTGSGSLFPGETLQLDSEQMLVLSVAAGVYTVQRAWNGTTLGAHGSTPVIYAYRTLSVTRGMYGTTATTANSGDAVYKHRVPPLVKDLSVAEVINQMLQEGAGYARTVGSGADAHPAPGADLASKWDEARTAHGRKARLRAV